MSDLTAKDLLTHLESRDRPARPGYELVHLAYAGVFPHAEDRDWFLAQPFFTERPARTREGEDAWERDLAAERERSRRIAEEVLPEAAKADIARVMGPSPDRPAQPAAKTAAANVRRSEGGNDGGGDQDDGQTFSKSLEIKS